jgi:rhamnosyltransferase subunit B
MVAIGRVLRQRGWDVVISLAEPYADVARNAGLEVEAILGRADFERLLDIESMWRPISGVREIFRQVVTQFLPRHFEVIRKHARVNRTVLIAHPLDFASRTYRDWDATTPLASVHLAPATILDPDHPSKLTSSWLEPSRPRWVVAGLMNLSQRWLLDPMYLPQLNTFRASLGLTAIKKPLGSWCHSPDRVLLMYPDWFGPRRSLDSRFIHCGFPLADHCDANIDLQVKDPIVFTSGTAHRHGKDFFRRSVDACVRLNRNGVLLTSHTENLPTSLPDSIQTLDYVPLANLLKHSVAIVHHGGIGTTGQSLASGIPQLIRPLAYDQFDNARIIHRLGCGRTLSRDRDLEERLQEILSSDSISKNASEYAARLAGTKGAIHAADAIEHSVN